MGTNSDAVRGRLYFEYALIVNKSMYHEVGVKWLIMRQDTCMPTRKSML